jgi:hypothetical protein
MFKDLKIAGVLCAVRFVFGATAVVTFALAVMPPSMAPHVFDWDKADHVLAFYTLTVLACASFPRTRLVILAVALSGFGGAIELIQGLPFVHRDCDVWDWVADGVAIAAVMAPITLFWWRNKTRAMLGESASSSSAKSDRIADAALRRQDDGPFP